MLTVLFGATVVLVLGSNGLLMWWVQSRTVPKVEQIKIGNAEMSDLARERKVEMDYLRDALNKCREDLDTERAAGG